MQSNLVSFNVPNIITINLMAWLGILFFILLYQFVGKRGEKEAPANNSGGY